MPSEARKFSTHQKVAIRVVIDCINRESFSEQPMNMGGQIKIIFWHCTVVGAGVVVENDFDGVALSVYAVRGFAGEELVE